MRCLIKRLHFLALLICEYISCWLRSCTIFVSFLISFLFLSLSCSLVSHFFHCNRSVYWWWCPSSSMVCGKRWTNYRRENRRFPPSLVAFVLFCAFPFYKRYFGLVSASSRWFFAFSSLAPVFFLSFKYFPSTSMTVNSSSTRDSFFKVVQWDVFLAFYTIIFLSRSSLYPVVVFVYPVVVINYAGALLIPA